MSASDTMLLAGALLLILALLLVDVRLGLGVAGIGLMGGAFLSERGE